MSKNIFLSFLISLFSQLNIAQSNYSLISMYDDKNYYSVVNNGENIFFGTDKGIYKIDELNNIILYDSKIIGSINSSLKKKELKIKKLTFYDK